MLREPAQHLCDIAVPTEDVTCDGRNLDAVNCRFGEGKIVINQDFQRRLPESWAGSCNIEAYRRMMKLRISNLLPPNMKRRQESSCKVEASSAVSKAVGVLERHIFRNAASLTEYCNQKSLRKRVQGAFACGKRKLINVVAVTRTKRARSTGFDKMQEEMTSKKFDKPQNSYMELMDNEDALSHVLTFMDGADVLTFAESSSYALSRVSQACTSLHFSSLSTMQLSGHTLSSLSSIQSIKLTDHTWREKEQSGGVTVEELLSTLPKSLINTVRCFEVSARLNLETLNILLQTLGGSNSILERLVLSHGAFGNAGAMEIAAYVSSGNFPSLRSLVVKGNFIGDLGASLLLQAAMSFPGYSLRTLDLSDNIITDESLTSITHSGRKNIVPIYFPTLKLCENFFSEEMINYIATVNSSEKKR